MNPLQVWLCVIGVCVIGWIVLFFTGSRQAPEVQEARAIEALNDEARVCDRAATEQMRRDCIQQVRIAWADGQISQDAYEYISGNIRNLE